MFSEPIIRELGQLKTDVTKYVDKINRTKLNLIENRLTVESIINTWLDKLVQQEENELEFRLRCASNFQQEICFLSEQFQTLKQEEIRKMAQQHKNMHQKNKNHEKIQTKGTENRRKGLESDYSRLLSKLELPEIMPSVLKSVTSSTLDTILKHQPEIIELQESIETKDAQLRLELKKIQNLQEKFHNLTNTHKNLLNSHSDAKTEFEELTNSYELIKKEKIMLIDEISNFKTEADVQNKEIDKLNEDLGNTKSKFENKFNCSKVIEIQCIDFLKDLQNYLHKMEVILQNGLKDNIELDSSMINSRSFVDMSEHSEVQDYCHILTREMARILNDLKCYIKTKDQFVTSLESEHRRTINQLEKRLSDEISNRDAIVRVEVEQYKKKVSLRLNVLQEEADADRKKQSIKQETIMEQVRADNEVLVAERDRFHQMTIEQMNSRHQHEIQEFSQLHSSEKERLKIKCDQELQDIQRINESKIQDLKLQLEEREQTILNMEKKIENVYILEQQMEDKEKTNLEYALINKEKIWKEKLKRITDEKNLEAEEHSRLHALEIDKLKSRLARKLELARKEWTHERDYLEEQFELIKHQCKTYIQYLSRKKKFDKPPKLDLLQGKHDIKDSIIDLGSPNGMESSQTHYRTLLSKYLRQSQI